ncbi:MAG: tRNA lysidine(34) synthetase TilS, partial [Nocardioides sp.]|nr:tRNA lysidine(34) synthetase TilS [Nocardioides sp.]
TASARVSVDPDGRGVEAAAREARYAVLGQLAVHVGSTVVLLGHTRDDQAETVLLGLARGSGGRSLAGMRRAFEHYRRPLLDVARADTVTACQVEGITYWNDPQNLDPAFTRVRVRRRVLPVLEDELGPGVAAALARTADQLREDTAFLDEIAAAAYAEVRGGSDPTLPLVGLRDLAPAVLGRVLRLAALEAGAIDAELFRVHVQALQDLVGGAVRGEIQLPGHVTAYLTAAPDRGHVGFRATAVER